MHHENEHFIQSKDPDKRKDMISVVIPTYNRSSMLKDCLFSLRDQSIDDYEVIVVDDGCNDDTKNVFESIKRKDFKYFRQENKGPAAARNLGIRNSKGKIIAFTDDDCVVDKDWLKAIKETLKNDIKCVKGQTNVLNTEYEFSIDLKKYIYISKKQSATNNIAYSRDVLDKIGWFDEKFPFAAGEDTDLICRFRLGGYKKLYNPKMVVWHRYEKDLDEFKRVSYRYGVGLRYFFIKYLKINLVFSFGQVLYQLPPLIYYPFFGKKGYLKMIKSLYMLRGFIIGK